MNGFDRFIRALSIGLAVALMLAPAAVAQHRIPPDPIDPGAPPANAKALVGQALFFDTSLSSPQGQSCASCHDPGNGWVDARSRLDPLYAPTSEGVVAGRYGPRNSLTMTYANLAPALFFDAATGGFIGGRYWDGRSATSIAGAKVPLLNPVEMNNSTVHQVVLSVKKSASAASFEKIYGLGIWGDEAQAFDAVAECLAAYQTVGALNAFSSRYDYFLRGYSGALTINEQAGLALFEGKGGCAACHPSSLQPDGTLPMFTTYRYYNLGVPKNPRNAFYGMPASINPDGRNYIDKGLGGAFDLPTQVGKFKVPTLRNVALTAPYMHNGAFVTLSEAVQFHNTRDIDPWWGPAEVAFGIATGPLVAVAPLSIAAGRVDPPGGGDDGGGNLPVRLGNLMLTPGEVGQIVAYLQTLSDEPVSAP